MLALLTDKDGRQFAAEQHIRQRDQFLLVILLGLAALFLGWLGWLTFLDDLDDGELSA